MIPLLKFIFNKPNFIPSLNWLLMVLLFVTNFSNLAVAFGNDYLIGAGDVIKINVFDYPDLSIETRVSESGRITFPLIGEVNIGGKSTAEAEKFIANELVSKDFVRQPHVTLIVSQFISHQISILGYVKNPGNYILEKPIGLLEALALAGGALPESDNRAILTRKEGNTPKSIDVDLFGLFQGDLSKDIEIKSRDIVYVTKAPVFYIYGEVQHPGVYKLERQMNVAQAIAAGGGLTSVGTDNSVEIKRRKPDQKFVTVPAELGDLVQPDDVIYTHEGWF